MDCNILRPAPVSSAMFTFVKDENLLVAEASSLPEFDRVYADSIDIGLTVVSARTGREVVYVVNEEMRRDGEVVGWNLNPATVYDRRDVSTRVTVFND